MIKLIVTDMDGTLLDQRGGFPEDFHYVFDLLKEKGITFCVASGRQYNSLKQFFYKYREDICFIAENGALVMAGDKEIYSNTIEREEVNEIVRLCRNIPEVGVTLCGKKMAYMETQDKEIQEKIAHYYLALEKVNDLLEVDDQIMKIAIYDKVNAEENINRRLEVSKNLKKVVSGSNWMDIANDGINKGVALEKLQDRLKVGKEETMVFGDYYNDIEMLEKSEHSYAMINAQEEVKQASKYITEYDNNNNGVLREIKKVILKD